MNKNPSISIIEKVIQSANQDRIKEYLRFSAETSNIVNEKTLRNGFRDLVINASNSDASDQAKAMMRALNGFYRTRYSIQKLESVVPIVYTAISSRGWWSKSPVSMINATDDDEIQLSSIVHELLNSTGKAQLDRPYSLITKFLHFSFPNSFCIYDSLAANSIQTWSYFSFNLNDPISEQFEWGKMADPAGLGYRALLKFYRFCFKNANEDQIRRLNMAAHDLTNEIAAPVSVVYLIDNLLWDSNGDPRKLGLI